MKHEMLIWNIFALVSKFHYVCFLLIKKLRLQRKNVFWQPKFNSIKLWQIIFVIHKTKTKTKSRGSKRAQNRNDRSACENMFSEFLSGILFKEKQHHTIDHTSIFIQCYFYAAYIDYRIAWLGEYWFLQFIILRFLQITCSLLRN